MAVLHITEKELNEAIDLKNQGKIAEAWKYLGNKGDAWDECDG